MVEFVSVPLRAPMSPMRLLAHGIAGCVAKQVTRPTDIADPDVGALDEAAFASLRQSIASARFARFGSAVSFVICRFLPSSGCRLRQSLKVIGVIAFYRV
jgi:hypothetical protein